MAGVSLYTRIHIYVYLLIYVVCVVYVHIHTYKGDTSQQLTDMLQAILSFVFID